MINTTFVCSAQRYLVSSFFAILIALTPFMTIAQTIYQNPEASIDNRVEDLLSRMTLYEKIGQMTQLNITMINPTGKQADVELVEEKAVNLIKNHHIGSFLNGEAVPPTQWYTFMNRLTRLAVNESRLGIPIIYGIDHMHGASYLEGSTIFPHSINLAATFDKKHTFETGRITALESADLGHHWIFAQVLDLGLNPKWPRFWETYGEDPYLASEMGAAFVKGLQESDEIDPYHLAATAKHFLAYSVPQTGWDRTPVQIGMQALHEFHRPSFQAAVDAGIKTVMLNSGEVNGIPVHASEELINGLLRNQMGFDGVVVTDWEDIGKLVDFHKVAENYKEATYLTIKAGVDMSMTPTSLQFNKALLELVEEGRISEERINTSVRRILRLKFELGLFENPYPRSDRFDRIGREEHLEIALRAAEESIVMLKNTDQVLPLENPQTIYLFGPSADSKRNLAGGWTLAWQGGREEQYPDRMHTLYSALREKYPNARVEILESVPAGGTSEQQTIFLDRVNSADLLIYAGGEEPYTEFAGNITDLTLPQNQLDEIELLTRSAAPTALVMIAGRPRVITDVISDLDVFIFAGLPGFEGARAISNILSGSAVPSGKLPFSYPQFNGHHVNYHHKSSDVYMFNPDEANQIELCDDNIPLFQFGEGLSYTTFEYSSLKLSDTEIDRNETITASVEITNTGDVTGHESVLWFISDLVGRYTRPVKALKYVEKVTLIPGETKTVRFEISPDKSLSYPDMNGKPLLEPGSFTLRIGPLTQNFILE